MSKRIPWNKNLKGEEYLKHYKDNKTWLMRNLSKNISNKANKTKRDLYAKGKLVPWNKDLTKETSTPMAIISEKLTGRILSKEHKSNVSNSQKGKSKPKLSETRKKLFAEGKIKSNLPPVPSGNKHWNWCDGASFEPYSPEFNKEFKNLVRLRDNFCCLNCNMSEQKHIIIQRKKLTIHHIDYNKKNTCLRSRGARKPTTLVVG